MIDNTKVVALSGGSEAQESLQWKRFLIAWCIYFFLVESFGTIFIRNGTALDFQAFYTSGYQARTHPSQLYDLERQAQIQRSITSIKGFLPFYHPSYEAIAFAPLSMLPYSLAYAIFSAVNMALLLTAFLSMRKSFPPNDARHGWRAELMFLFFPLLLSLLLGQDTLLMLSLYCVAWRELESNRDGRAGALVALALFKFQIALPIAGLIGIRRGWRFIRAFLAVSSGLALVSIAFPGWAEAKGYIRLLLGAAFAVDSDRHAQLHMNVFPLAMPNIAGLLYGFGGRFFRSQTAFHLLAAICALAFFLLCARVVRRCELNYAVAIAILCGLLANDHFYFYDLTLSLLPLALLGGAIHRYIVIALFSMPVLLFILGMDWYFLMAVPILAMLINAIIVAGNHASLPTSPLSSLAPAEEP